MNLPKISVITATLNSEKVIADCINSVLNQSYKNIEFIIMDGGSTDKTVSIIKSVEPLFSGRIVWVSQKDKGIYDAWNKGIKMSTGDWISFLGSDDLLMSDAISEYVAAINANPGINYISSNVLQVTENLQPLRLVGKPWSDEMRSFCCISHVGSLHNKSLFNEIGLFNTNYHIAGDYDFLLRSLRIIKPYYLAKTTAKTRMGGISDRKIFRVAREVLKTKLNNKSKSNFYSYMDFCEMVFKYFARELLNFFKKIFSFKKNPDPSML